MNKTFTQDHLLLYVYGELEPLETQELEAALPGDPQLQASLTQLLKTLSDLDALEVKPSQTSLDIITGYAQEQHPELH